MGLIVNIHQLVTFSSKKNIQFIWSVDQRNQRLDAAERKTENHPTLKVMKT